MLAEPCCSRGQPPPTVGPGSDQARDLSPPVALGMQGPAQMEAGWPPSLAQASAVGSRAVCGVTWSCQLWGGAFLSTLLCRSGNPAQHGPLDPGEPGRCSHGSRLCVPLSSSLEFHSQGTFNIACTLISNLAHCKELHCKAYDIISQCSSLTSTLVIRFFLALV